MYVCMYVCTEQSLQCKFLIDLRRNLLRTGSHVSDDEIRQAEEKFAESLHLAQMGMFNLLENDVSYGWIYLRTLNNFTFPMGLFICLIFLFFQVEQVAQLATFSEALLEYHQQCIDVLRILTEKLLEKYVKLRHRLYIIKWFNK